MFTICIFTTSTKQHTVKLLKNRIARNWKNIQCELLDSYGTLFGEIVTQILLYTSYVFKGLTILISFQYKLKILIKILKIIVHHEKLDHLTSCIFLSWEILKIKTSDYTTCSSKCGKFLLLFILLKKGD